MKIITIGLLVGICEAIYIWLEFSALVSTIRMATDIKCKDMVIDKYVYGKMFCPKGSK